LGNLPVTGKNSYYLLFTDGFSNFGEREIPAKLVAPVYAFSSAGLSNHNLLKIIGRDTFLLLSFSLLYLARQSGGQYHKINSSTDISSIIRNIGKPAFSFISATFDSTMVNGVYPSIPTPVQKASLKLSGILKTTKPTTITLNYGFGTKITHQAVYKVIGPVHFPSLNPFPSSSFPTSWHGYRSKVLGTEKDR